MNVSVCCLETSHRPQLLCFLPRGRLSWARAENRTFDTFAKTAFRELAGWVLRNSNYWNFQSASVSLCADLCLFPKLGFKFNTRFPSDVSLPFSIMEFSHFLMNDLTTNPSNAKLYLRLFYPMTICQINNLSYLSNLLSHQNLF